jgi:hypothetical protein
MIAMVDMINKKPKFRGKFKNKSFCNWFKMPGKTYVIEDNKVDSDSDSDSDNSNDYDKGDLINGNKTIEFIYRRRGIFKLFKL